jgi:hypothetical protein
VSAVTALWFDAVAERERRTWHPEWCAADKRQSDRQPSRRSHAWMAMDAAGWVRNTGHSAPGPHVKISSRAAIYHVDRLPTLWIKRIYFPAVPTGE